MIIEGLGFIVIVIVVVIGLCIAPFVSHGTIVFVLRVGGKCSRLFGALRISISNVISNDFLHSHCFYFCLF